MRIGTVTRVCHGCGHEYRVGNYLSESGKVYLGHYSCSPCKQAKCVGRSYAPKALMRCVHCNTGTRSKARMCAPCKAAWRCNICGRGPYSEHACAGLCRTCERGWFRFLPRVKADLDRESALALFRYLRTAGVIGRAGRPRKEARP